jgi:hypothetical protein
MHEVPLNDIKWIHDMVYQCYKNYSTLFFRGNKFRKVQQTNSHTIFEHLSDEENACSFSKWCNSETDTFSSNIFYDTVIRHPLWPTHSPV